VGVRNVEVRPSISTDPNLNPNPNRKFGPVTVRTSELPSFKLLCGSESTIGRVRSAHLFADDDDDDDNDGVADSTLIERCRRSSQADKPRH